VTGESFARSPLEGRSEALATLGASVLPFLTQVDLRVDPAQAGRASIPLPLEPNSSSHHDEAEVLWLGPDEWLFVSSSPRAEAIVGMLETAFDHVDRSIVDVSANRVTIELAGPERLLLLPHVCSLDLEPPAWVAGRCAQTLVGRAQVLLYERDDATRLFVRPSFAGYLTDLLLEVRSVAGDLRA
jgi:sarcosine oxidase subunit gamma